MRKEDKYILSILPAISMFNEVVKHIDNKKEIDNIIYNYNKNTDYLKCKYSTMTKETKDDTIIMYFEKDLSFLVFINKDGWKTQWSK